MEENGRKGKENEEQRVLDWELSFGAAKWGRRGAFIAPPI